MRQFVVFLPQYDDLLLLLCWATLLLSAEWDNKKKSRHLHYPHTFELSFTQAHVFVSIRYSDLFFVFVLLAAFEHLYNSLCFFVVVGLIYSWFLLELICTSFNSMTWNVKLRLIGKYSEQKYNECKLYFWRTSYTNTHPVQNWFDNSNVILNNAKQNKVIESWVGACACISVCILTSNDISAS